MVYIPPNYKLGLTPSEPKSKIFVVKRDGRKEPIMFDKITSRIQKLCYNLDLDSIDPSLIALKVINGLYSGVSTVELDNIAADHAIKMSDQHQDYGILAARIETSNLHKETKKTFSDVIEDLYTAGNELKNKHPKMNKSFYDIIKKNEDTLNSAIIYDRDFSYSYFAMKALQDDFLKKINGKVVERPQHMHMRIAVAIHGSDITSVVETYNLLSERLYMHSPTTMTNAGFVKGQLLSEYCLAMKDDSIEGIYDSVKDFGLIARSGGTVGFNVTCIRCMGSYIAGTNGTSNGLTPMLRVFNSTAQYTHQGGKISTALITIYLEPWHADIFDYLALRKPSGKEEQRARHLSYALIIPDLFMKRVEENGDWCLMCPHDSDRLRESWGKEFEDLYIKYENEGRLIRKVKARQLWFSIIEAQLMTGGPAMLYKDNCNKKSNHKNSGKCLSSSFSGELMTYPSSDEMLACGAGTICVDMFVQPTKMFDFVKLKETVKIVVKTLDKVIDVNNYPVEESKLGTQKHRPMAIGIQGLADAFILMGYAFESDEARLLNKQIFETLYFGALEASCDLAQEFGPYESYEESLVKEGIFQFDLWDVTPTALHDFEALKEKVKKIGIRNSLLLACAPSSVTANIHGCTPGTQALSSNFEGNMKVVNQHLLKNLSERGLWNEEVLAALKDNDGSVQNIELVPEDVKELHKTVWEIPQKTILEMAVERGAFIDQSQSIDVCIPNINYGKLTSMHFFAWKEGLKTGMVNLQTRTQTYPSNSKVDEQVIEITKDAVVSNGEGTETNGDGNISGEENENVSAMVCSLENKDECLMCGS